jgi:uncharacterized lipoprotein YmbA
VGRIAVSCAVVLGVATLAGCATSPATRFYELTPIAANGAEASPVSGTLTISVRSVKLPAGLDRPQIVTRTGANTVHLAEFDRWLAPLHDSIMHLLAQNLATLLPRDRVAVFPWPPGMAVDLEVIVEVTRLDGQLGGPCVLDAQWQILPRKGMRRAINGQSRLSEASGSDYAALVSAYSRLLGALSAEIAGAIRNGAR